MDWVRAHYERVLSILAAVLLFLSSILISRNAARFSSQLAVMPPAPSLKSVSPLAKAQELAAAAEKLHRPPQWTPGQDLLRFGRCCKQRPCNAISLGSFAYKFCQRDDFATNF